MGSNTTTTENIQKFWSLGSGEKRAMLSRTYGEDDARKAHICAEGYEAFKTRMKETGLSSSGLDLLVMTGNLHESEGVHRLMLGYDAVPNTCGNGKVPISEE